MALHIIVIIAPGQLFEQLQYLLLKIGSNRVYASYSNPKSVAGSDRPQSLAQQQTNSESDFGLL
jgi:hypothetical protein